VRDRRGNSGAVEEEVGLLPEDEKWLVHIIDVSVNSNMVLFGRDHTHVNDPLTHFC
jgi:hypothetical protein